MLSFSQYLFERYDTQERPGGGFSHTANIKGNHVDMAFGRTREGQYHINFAVNGSQTRGQFENLSPEHGRAIMHHVHSVVSQFIEQRKPNMVFFGASDRNKTLQDKKLNLYHQFAKRLTRRFPGSTYEHDKDLGMVFWHAPKAVNETVERVTTHPDLPTSRFDGTRQLVLSYLSQTPGQGNKNGYRPKARRSL